MVNKENYFAPETMSKYWSVSQFKTFNRCEALGLAEARHEYVREDTDALLIGSYVDAYFSGDLNQFVERHMDQMFSKRGGGLLAKFQHADEIIETVTRQPLMMDYLTDGEKQVVMTADMFGLPWKVKMDVYNGSRIVDLKVVRDFDSIWDKGYGRRSWIEYWGYDVQGAVYQKVVEIVTGKQLPFFLVAVTKEKIPDVKIIEIPQHILDAALGMVEAKIERFDLIKTGQVEPIRCEECDYCKKTKIIRAPEVYEIEEAR
ncbi:MAG: PD-(D/E)XK nuclease-like domain-containing protein [Lachnospiraceae bacterium]|nr:PD-(D/E)XK nuclease-like domain-containing protein [Lachnospiraceae bacterium]